MEASWHTSSSSSFRGGDFNPGSAPGSLNPVVFPPQGLGPRGAVEHAGVPIQNRSYHGLEGLRGAGSSLHVQPLKQMMQSDSEPSLIARAAGAFGRPPQDDDIFSSVGGLELGQDVESELLEQASTSSGHDKVVEQSRTLMIKGVHPDTPDEELANVLQSLGEVQKLYTASKQRGLVLVSYFDMRAAANALSRLHGSTIRGSALEVHFAAPKLVNGVDDCTVQVFNLDPDTTNDHMLWLFSKFGEVKGITESPHRRNQKFISFYDVRHAAAAQKSMNRAEHLGKLPSEMTAQQVALLSQLAAGSTPNLLELATQLQSEGWDPNVPGAVEGLLNAVAAQQQRVLSSRNLVPAPGGGSPLLGTSPASGPSGNPSAADMQQQLAANLKFNMELATSRGLHISDSASSFANVSNNPAQFFGPNSSPVLVGAGLAGLAQAGRGGMGPKLAPLAETVEGVGNGVPNVNNIPGINNVPNMGSVNLNSLYQNMAAMAGGQQSMMPGLSPAEAANVLMNLNLNDPQQLWGGQVNPLAAGQAAAAAAVGPGAWANNMYMNANNNLAAAAAALGLPLNLAQIQELQQRQQQQQQIALANLAQLQAQGLANANINAANLAAAQLLQAAGLNSLGGPAGQPFLPHGLQGSAAAQLLQQAGLGIPHSLPLHQPGGGMNSRGGSNTSLASIGSGSGLAGRQDGPRSGGRLSRRNADPVAEQERRAQQDRMYALDLDKIRRGEDKRTTLMIKNIPNKYTQKMLLATLDEHFKGTYDFFYLPIDFKNKCNVGYAFMNMVAPEAIIPLTERFNQKKWERFNSEKVCNISYARIQGRAALVAHFQNSSLMHEDKRCRPLLFNTDGTEVEPEPFPIPPSIRPRSGNNSFRDAGTSRDATSGREKESTKEREMSSSSLAQVPSRDRLQSAR